MIKLVILDVDGVLTDGKKYYNRDGDVVMKTFCYKDWTAIKRFKALGIKVLFLSGDPFNEKIAKNRNIDIIINRKDGTHNDKGDYVEEWSNGDMTKYKIIKLIEQAQTSELWKKRLMTSYVNYSRCSNLGFSHKEMLHANKYNLQWIQFCHKLFFR